MLSISGYFRNKKKKTMRLLVRRLLLKLLRKLLYYGAGLGLLVLGGSVLIVLPLRWLTPPTSSFMWQHAIEVNHRWIPWAEMSPLLAVAVIAAEDQRFASHSGFDFTEIAQAISEYRQGKRLRGASTISQQLVKNLYLWPDRSVWRKVLEGWLTLLVELFWSKQRILEVYLNIVQFGPKVYGAEAASWQFFQRPAIALNKQQAALLAAVLPAPVRLRADQPDGAIRQKQVWIMQQMNQLGGLSYLEKLK